MYVFVMFGSGFDSTGHNDSENDSIRPGGFQGTTTNGMVFSISLNTYETVHAKEVAIMGYHSNMNCHSCMTP